MPGHAMLISCPSASLRKLKKFVPMPAATPDGVALKSPIGVVAPSKLSRAVKTELGI